MEDQAASLPREGTIHELLDVRALEATDERVMLELDVTPRVHQPMGLLHGGVSAVLAESAASIGSFLSIDTSREFTVGTDLNITHLRAKREGTIRATATPVRKGRTMHVWNIAVDDEGGKPVAVARCTLAVRPRPSSRGSEDT